MREGVSGIMDAEMLVSDVVTTNISSLRRSCAKRVVLFIIMWGVISQSLIGSAHQLLFAFHFGPNLDFSLLSSCAAPADVRTIPPKSYPSPTSIYGMGRDDRLGNRKHVLILWSQIFIQPFRRHH
jgi:hypothetical protein